MLPVLQNAIYWRRWLGLRCDQVERMLRRKNSPLDPALLQSLSAVDKKKIKSMLSSDPVQNMPKYARELGIMLAGERLILVWTMRLVSCTSRMNIVITTERSTNKRSHLYSIDNKQSLNVFREQKVRVRGDVLNGRRVLGSIPRTRHDH